MTTDARFLLLELNEFNDRLLKESAKNFQLKNIQAILAFPHIRASSEDTYESDLLEPWVQWVCIHTGTSSSTHGVRHLGDVSSMKFRQIWERLSEHGVSTGVWGVLN